MTEDCWMGGCVSRGKTKGIGPRDQQRAGTLGGLPTGSTAAGLFANHTSHLDFVVLWLALARELRARGDRRPWRHS